MELNRLKIDRKSPAMGARPTRAGSWLWPLIVLAGLGGSAWLFHKPLLQRVDLWILPRVKTWRIAPPSPATTTVTGAAANGYIIARTRAALSADTPGRIVELNVAEGSFVAKNQVVARLYDAEYRAALARAEADVSLARTGVLRALAEIRAASADLDALVAQSSAADARFHEAQAEWRLAKRQLERIVAMRTKGFQAQSGLDDAEMAVERSFARQQTESTSVAAAKAQVSQGRSRLRISEAALSQARAQVDAAEATRNQAKATLDKTEVRAPFDGIVVLKDAEVGEVVSPNSSVGGNARGSVVTMVDFKSLEVQVDLSEANLSAVTVGGAASIFVDAFPTEPYQGRVERIWPTANRQKATVEVRVAFDSIDARLRPEMGVRVVFGARDPSAGPSPLTELSIPSEAVFRTGGRSCVFLIDRDRARLRPVVLGAERQGRVVVNEGLTVGDIIALKPPISLADGDRVLLEENP